MIEQDTIRLLRECDAGVKMGTASMDQVMDRVESGGLRTCLQNSKAEHERLNTELENLLGQYHDQGKDPNPIAKGMSWMKTNLKLGMDGSDRTIAELMTGGCDMGVRSLSRYLNQYQAADERSKDIAKRLIRLEEELAAELRRFL